MRRISLIHPRTAGFVLLLLSASAGAQTDLLRDLARLQKETNAERHEALAALLKERGIPFEVQAFDGASGAGSNFLVAFGSGRREIVVGAHYDAVKLKDGRLSRGMVDNGAGVMALAGLAQALRNRPLRHRVRIAFFDREETGLVGSKSYIAAHPGEIAAAVNVDIMAYGNAFPYGGGKKEGSAPLYRALQRVCAARRLACLEFPAFPPGDDRSFEAAGIPNLSLGMLPEVEAHQLWLLLNGGKESGLREGFLPSVLHHIHSPEDTLDQVEPAAVEKASGVLLDLVTELDATLD
ncbi:MAG: M20/M25/M40 family metallo-hydrolase [Thermoanaerobaculia bacterium]